MTIQKLETEIIGLSLQDNIDVHLSGKQRMDQDVEDLVEAIEG